MARRIIVVAAVATAAALAIGGIALADGLDDSDGNRPTAVAAPRLPAAPPVAPTVTPEQATTTALQTVGGGQVREIELEHEHGRQEWSVDVIKDGVRHDVRIDAASGAVTRQDLDDDSDDRDDGRDACDD